MKTLEQLLEEWEEGTLTPEGVAELKQLLSAPEARANLVKECHFYNGIHEALRADPAQAAEAAPQPVPRRLAPARRPASGGWRRLLPFLVWREVRVSIPKLAMAAAAVVAAFAAVFLYLENQPSARVSELRGQIAVERGNKKLTPRLGQWLFPGDLVRVPAGASAVLAWKGEATRFELGPGSDFKILGQTLGKHLSLRAGKAWVAAAPQPKWRPMTVNTPSAEVSVVGTRFSLDAAAASTRLQVTDGAVLLRKKEAVGAEKQPVTVRAGQSAVAGAETALRVEPISGCAVRELLAFPPGTPLFAPASGQRVYDDLVTNLVLVGSPPIPPLPGTNRFEQRLRCYLIPPVTGDYTFWISSARRSQLWFSPSDDPSAPRQIASMPLWPGRSSGAATDPTAFLLRLAPSPDANQGSDGPQATLLLSGSFSQHPSQKSAPQRLAAGQRYFLEVMQEYDPNGLANYVFVGWTKPGQSPRSPSGIVEGSVLSPFFSSSSRGERASTR